MEAAETGNRAVVTVVGVDRIGIIAGISQVLMKNGVNILDISMTVLQEFFAMILIADLSRAKSSFSSLVQELQQKGAELGVKVNVEQEEIFKMMHRI